MKLEYIFALISMIFLLVAIVYVFKKPRYFERIEVIFISLLGTWIYGGICGASQVEVSIVGVILGIVTGVFFITLIFCIFSKPVYMEKWKAILICFIGFMYYGILFGLTDKIK